MWNAEIKNSHQTLAEYIKFEKHKKNQNTILFWYKTFQTKFCKFMLEFKLYNSCVSFSRPAAKFCNKLVSTVFVFQEAEEQVYLGYITSETWPKFKAPTVLHFITWSVIPFFRHAINSANIIHNSPLCDTSQRLYGKSPLTTLSKPEALQQYMGVNQFEHLTCRFSSAIKKSSLLTNFKLKHGQYVTHPELGLSMLRSELPNLYSRPCSLVGLELPFFDDGLQANEDLATYEITESVVLVKINYLR